ATTALFFISGFLSSSPNSRSPAVTAAMPASCAVSPASSSSFSTIGASTILTSQIPVDKWHAFIGDPTYADAILDRLVHNAHRIDLAGESLRRKRSRSIAKD